MAVKNYIREKFFPHIWCSGCGHGIVLNALLRAFEDLEINKNDVVMVSGIGCSSRISGYVDFHSMHTIHGRALAFATGARLSLPKAKIVVPMGDGDALSIGGNHFMHSARRNIDITVIIMNNRIYGMTGGQYSPLSGRGTIATTSPYSSIDQAFDIAKISKAAGATFVSRGTTYHVKELINLIKEAISHIGFSVVEVLSQCPTYFGRKNNQKDAVEMMKNLKKTTTLIGSRAKEENPNLIERGVFLKKDMPEYCQEYNNIIKQAMKER